MKIEIISNKYNKLLGRNEIIFNLSHEGSATPSRIEVRKELARMLKIDVERVYIRKIETMTGTMVAKGEAHVYDSPEQARRIEPEHIIIRNSPQKKEKEEE